MVIRNTIWSQVNDTSQSIAFNVFLQFCDIVKIDSIVIININVQSYLCACVFRASVKICIDWSKTIKERQ